MKLETMLSRRQSSVIDAEKALCSAEAARKEPPEDSSPGEERKEPREGLVEKFTSCRWVVGYLCCAARFCQSAIRQLIGMAVVCMTLRSSSSSQTSPTATQTGFSANSTIDRNVNSTTPPQVVAEFAWSPEFEALILNSFNIGFFFTPIIGGQIATAVGGKRVIAVSLLAGSIVTILLPPAAQLNEVLVVILRILAGMFLGVVDPAIQALWAKWAPKYEKAQLTTCSYTGLSIAGIVTFFISGYLCGITLENGWPFIFYFFGGFTLLCFIPWMFLVYDSPDRHPRILEKEICIINLGKTSLEIKNKKMATPWKAILTSGPFWAIVTAHICYTWVMSWILAYLPKYLKVVMLFDVEDNGFYSSLPFVGRMLTGFLCGWLSDWLLGRNVFSTATVRKIFQVVGCLGCAVCTLLVGFLDNNRRMEAVALLVLAMSFQNCTSVAFRINHLDIAPRFAGVMMGMTVTVAMAASLTGPPLTAAIVRENTREEWLIVFIVVSGFNIFGAVIFALFASGEVQKWALPPKSDSVDHSPVVAEDSNAVVARTADDQVRTPIDLTNGYSVRDEISPNLSKNGLPVLMDQNEAHFDGEDQNETSVRRLPEPTELQGSQKKSESSHSSDTDFSDLDAEGAARSEEEKTQMTNDDGKECSKVCEANVPSAPESRLASSTGLTEKFKKSELPKTHLALRKRISSTDLSKYLTTKKGTE